MLQWRWKLRQARQAVADGRYDEACRLLADPHLQEFLPAKRLTDELAKKLADRAGKRIGEGRSAAGFADLAVADNLAAKPSRVAAVRDDYAGQAADEAVARLIGGGDTAAAEVVARAARRGVDNRTLRLLAETADLCHTAERAMKNGQIAAAEDAFRRAAGLIEAAEDALGSDDRRRLAGAIHRRAEAAVLRRDEHQTAKQQMTEALADQRWSEVLGAVENVLRLAPNDEQAIAVRRRAWKELGLEATRHYDPGRPAPVARRTESSAARRRSAAQAVARELRRSTHHRPDRENNVNARSTGNDPPPRRRMLWIDNVGSLLVCLDDEVALGQPAGDPARSPAVPILADLSRRHALIRREAGRYVLVPIGHVRVDGREVSETTILSDQCVLELARQPGERGVRFRFEKPHALSATARLTPESGHRLSPPADAVLLMADSCVLGPAGHCHVRCRDWAGEVVLFRRGEEILCRATGPLMRDGVKHPGPMAVAEKTRIEGQDFAFTVEDPDTDA